MTKSYFYTTIIATAVLALITACNGDKKAPVVTPSMQAETDDNAPADSTIYGVCGEGTSMNMLEVVSDTGDTLSILVDDEPSADPIVKGGLMAGDRLAVTSYSTPEGMKATSVVNLTSLMGRWTSIAGRFEMLEGGEVKTDHKSESTNWTSWKMLNGRLILSRDTFNVANLGADSLFLENEKGIYVFNREHEE